MHASFQLEHPPVWKLKRGESSVFCFFEIPLALTSREAEGFISSSFVIKCQHVAPTNSACPPEDHVPSKISRGNSLWHDTFLRRWNIHAPVACKKNWSRSVTECCPSGDTCYSTTSLSVRFNYYYSPGGMCLESSSRGNGKLTDHVPRERLQKRRGQPDNVRQLDLGSLQGQPWAIGVFLQPS